ncbi:MAG TPA: hypothetical protein VHC90_12325 [Bryobacteraceae bacterium]|nr:hypothetical protein [Bryobacteraceae bacterium]
MHEPSLFELATQHPDAVAYRLLLLRDDDRPVAIRFAPRPGGTAWFYRRVTGGTGLTRPTRLRDSGMSFSWKSRTASFLKTIDNVGFWTLPDTPAAPGVPCRSHWILEGVKLGRYKVIDRCSPDDRDPVRVIGTQAMHLASLRLHGSKLY